MSVLIQTRAEFQQLAEDRLLEAKVLLDVGKWDGAYYLAGYAIELALKACVIKMLMGTDAFPKKKFSESCYTHNLADLVKVVGLDATLKTAMAGDRVLADNWDVVLLWSEEKRYHRVTESEARALYSAIGDATHGVLQWVKTCW